MNSQFFTTIPCHTDRVKALLPKGSDIQGLTYDAEKDALTLHWSNERIPTRYTHGNEVTVEQLQKPAKKPAEKAQG